MRVLITGANGFLGRNLVLRLGDKHETTALVRPGQTTPLAAHVVEADLRGPVSPAKLPSGIDAVVHLAQASVKPGESAVEMFDVNTRSTIELLEWSRRAGASRFIFASSGDVYRSRVGPCVESDALEPASFYAVTKRASELLTAAYGDYFGSCVLRFFHPYGPGQSSRLIPNLAKRIQSDEPVFVDMRDGPGLTPIYIDDAITAIEGVLASSWTGAMNVAGDAVVTIRDLADAIGRIVGREPVVVRSDEERGDLMGDNALMKRVLGSWPMVRLEEGLSRAI
jgi:nucleoside-diphosphate-sugar epimerase